MGGGIFSCAEEEGESENHNKKIKGLETRVPLRGSGDPAGRGEMKERPR